MRVSITAPQFSTSLAPVSEAARFAEQAGLDGIFLFDHLVPLGDPSRPVLELAATLGAVASMTTSITIGALVMRAPLRGAEVSAAIATTAGMIAPGRLIIGLGAGDTLSVEEAERFGQGQQPLQERVAVVESTVSLLAGAGITRWVGGTHPLVLAAARDADGWNGWSLTPARFRRLADGLRSDRPDLELTWGGSVVLGRNQEDLGAVMAERRGADVSLVGTPDGIVAALGDLALAGAQHVVLSLLPNRRERWELFGELVLDRLR
jgi:alkanesulfonate monooxygenase SsuD/methylene tetrahydromethanopterin reductase-like flavin-dependent oxidoreductase (luciferase family)